jgi:hypothetical protein
MKGFISIGLALIILIVSCIPLQAQKPAASLLTPTNHALVLIDHESQMAFPVTNIAVESLRNNVALIAGGSRIFKIPTLVTTVSERSSAVPCSRKYWSFIPQAPPNISIAPP